MEDLFGINAHRQAVQENIEKAFDLGFDADNNIEGIEKAKHQVGDIHPNGRWVWTEWAPGKFDWKSLKGKHHKNSASSQSNQQTTAQQQITDDKEVASFMDKIKIFSNKYNDPSKVSVSKTPKGGWNVRYDGHRLGIFNASTLSEETANKQGWNEGSGEKFKQRWKNKHKDLSDETIQSYADNSRDVKYKQDVVDAAKELLEERKKEKKKDEKSNKLKDLKKKIKDVYGDESEPTITDKNTILIKRPYGTIMEHYKASNKLGVAVKADFVLSDKHANCSLYEISLDNSEKMEEYEKEADNDRKLENRFSYLF